MIGKRISVLLLDDEADVLDSWKDLLEQQGMRVLASATLDRALALVSTAPCDVAVVDYVMPKHNGLEAIQEVKQACPFIRTILVSGKLDHEIYSKEDVRRDVRERASCDEYFVKPVDANVLVECIKRLAQAKPDTAQTLRDVAKDYVRVSRVKPPTLRALAKRLDRSAARRGRRRHR